MPHPQPLAQGARGETLTPDPSPTGRGEIDSLPLRGRVRVRDNGAGVQVRRARGETLTPVPSPGGRVARPSSPSPLPTGEGRLSHPQPFSRVAGREGEIP